MPKKLLDVLSPAHSSHQLISELTSRRLQQEETNVSCSLCGSYDLIGSNIWFDDYNCSTVDQLVQAATTTEECSLLKPAINNCCDTPPQYQCQEQIRSSIIDGLDFTVSPIRSILEPYNITVDFTYHTVEEMNVQLGYSNVLSTIYLTWKDDRLKWDIDDDKCTYFIPVRASYDAELTEIWVPDLDLLNRIDGLSNFRDEQALVGNDGTVYWLRSGTLRAFCQFTGLAKIPYDTIGCQFIFGPGEANRFLNFNYEIDPTKENGISFGNFEPTYNEYVIDATKSYGDKDDVSGYLYFNLYFDRAARFYVLQIVIPTILLTYLSFLAFFLDLRIGERLSFAMALAVVIVAQQIITSDRLPVSRAPLWIDTLVVYSFYWLVLVMVESVVIGFLYFLQEDYNTTHKEEEEEGLAAASTPEEGVNEDSGNKARKESGKGWIQVGSESKKSVVEATKTFDNKTDAVETTIDEATSEVKTAKDEEAVEPDESEGASKVVTEQQNVKENSANRFQTMKQKMMKKNGNQGDVEAFLT